MSWLQNLLGNKPQMPTDVPSPDQERSLVLYKFNSCPYCMRVQRKISSLGLDVQMKDTMMDREAGKELRDATRRTTVPCLFIDGVPLFESADIVVWLEAYASNQSKA